MAVYKIMSMNMLTDGLYNFGDSRFRHRIKAINELIRIKDPDVIGVQELTDAMKPYMTEIFRKYRMIGESRGSLFTDEYCAILFKPEIFALKEEGTLWLSSHPDKRGSKLALSQFPRITTYAVLYDIFTDHTFTLFNTHLDHAIPFVRHRQAEILCELIGKYQKGDFTALCGDFNTYRGAGTLELFEAIGLRDTVDDAIGSTLRGKIGRKLQHDKPIDHIFISEPARLISLEKLDQKYAGYYPSDHYPLMAVISD